MSEIRFLLISKFSKLFIINIEPSIIILKYTSVGHTFYYTHWLLSANTALKYLDYFTLVSKGQKKTQFITRHTTKAVTLIW